MWIQRLVNNSYSGEHTPTTVKEEHYPRYFFISFAWSIFEALPSKILVGRFTLIIFCTLRHILFAFTVLVFFEIMLLIDSKNILDLIFQIYKRSLSQFKIHFSKMFNLNNVTWSQSLETKYKSSSLVFESSILECKVVDLPPIRWLLNIS